MADIPSTPADGNVKVVFAPALADPAAPTTAELSGAGVQDLSCYLTADGWTPGLDEQVVSDDRLCDTQTYEAPGRHTRSLSIKYVDNPTDTANNAAYSTLVPGTKGFLVVRRGVPYGQAFAAGDVVDVWPITAGQYDKQPPEANSTLKTAQKAFVTGPVKEDVDLAA